MERRVVWELDWELESRSFSEKSCKNKQESSSSQLEKYKVKYLLIHSKREKRNATINCHGYKKTPKFMLTKGNQLLKKTASSSEANFFSNHDMTSIWEASPKYETDGLIISDSSTKYKLLSGGCEHAIIHSQVTLIKKLDGSSHGRSQNSGCGIMPLSYSGFHGIDVWVRWQNWAGK